MAQGLEDCRESVLRLYTDVISGQRREVTAVWRELTELVGGLDPTNMVENAGVYNILADLCCELCYEELRHGGQRPELIACLAGSPLAIKLGFCCSLVQRMSEEECLAEPLVLFLRELMAALPPADTLVQAMSLDTSVCHTLEVLYRELYDLEDKTASVATTLLATSPLHPAVLLSGPNIIKWSQHPELTASVIRLGGALLPRISSPIQHDLYSLVSVAENLDWQTTSVETGEEDSADIELVAVWIALITQLMVRAAESQLEGCDDRGVLYGKIFDYCVSALAINRLGLIARIMTEEVDVGLLALSETHTTDLTAVTSGIETLICLLQSQLVGIIAEYFGSAAAAAAAGAGTSAHPLLAHVHRSIATIVKKSDIIDASLEAVVTDWLLTDALCFVVTDLRWTCPEIEAELSAGVLKDYFQQQLNGVGSTMKEDVPCVENWVRAFLLSTLLRLLICSLSVDELLALSRLLVTPAWWSQSARQKRLQASYVFCHLVEQLVSLVDVAEVEGGGAPAPAALDSASLIAGYAAALSADDAALVGILTIMWTRKDYVLKLLLVVYDETSEAPVKEWCVVAHQALQQECVSATGRDVLAQFHLVSPHAAADAE